MSVRPVFAMLIALAMLLVPVSMQSGSARAAMPADHHAQMMDSSHCSGDTGNAGQGGDHNCCAAMCAAAALAPAMAADLPMLTRGNDRPGIEHFGRSHLAKLPTPPPRLA